MSKELLQKNIRSIELLQDLSFKTANGVVGFNGGNAKQELKNFLIQSHISMLEEEIKELEGMKKKIHTPHFSWEEEDFIYNQAIQDVISHKEKELEVIREML